MVATISLQKIKETKTFRNPGVHEFFLIRSKNSIFHTWKITRLKNYLLKTGKSPKMKFNWIMKLFYESFQLKNFFWTKFPTILRSSKVCVLFYQQQQQIITVLYVIFLHPGNFTIPSKVFSPFCTDRHAHAKVGFVHSFENW